MTDWTALARARVRPERLAELVCGLVERPSPTGDELAVASYAADVLADAGLAADVQPLDARQANARARLPGTGQGSALLLYAPIDTLTTGLPEADAPWTGPERTRQAEPWPPQAGAPAQEERLPDPGPGLRPDLLPEPRVFGDHVVGLGAGNPKGHAACVLAAAEAIAAAGVPLAGDLLVGLGAGGMPTNALRLGGDPRRHTGQGVGCSFLLEQGWWADHAVIAKPGWAAAHEEVGLAWFDVRVPGTHTYVGSRHRMPYRNAIAAAADVVARLEEWFAEYAAAHTEGTCAPQGIVASITAGNPRMAAVTPAECVIRCDVRLTPGTSPLAVKRELEAVLGGSDARCELVLAIPGTRTDPADPVVRAAVAAWEELEGRPHQPMTGMSGATDANILRGRGIPTVRIGMPKPDTKDLPVDPSTDFAMGMNTVDVRQMVRLTHALIRIALDVTGVADAR
ncbi:peptidase dimerization domain-containing protein [Actinocorallia sp. A-T 12471]|uniref:peptidase dimerization domain-containing protein n=1 Tax=Actinocorallia sp. A-T 12471 TaxID=3089813 RepID=UPI0029CD622F|nr:peptidase dimerization domain-containing protein [Actinocorallia sp. A-T 12471]MDX6742398.1 peptidase dimerization domain-containing protein [Actinocorallia sp. A-T 12471]